MEKLLEQEEIILRQQQEIWAMINQLEDKLDAINFKVERQNNKINARLEINERSTTGGGMEKLLEQQELILRQQQEILSTISRLEEKLDMINFKVQRQHDEINSRLEINERSTRQIDEQLALANELRRNESTELKPTLEQLKLLEEFLRLDVATRLINNLEGES